MRTFLANSIRARRLLKPSATRPDIRLQPIYVLPNHEISLAKPGGVHIRYSSSQALRFIFEPALYSISYDAFKFESPDGTEVSRQVPS